MATLHFDITEYGHTPPGTSPTVVEVSASGEDIAELARNAGVPYTGKPLVLGALFQNGEVYQEFSLDLGIEPSWIREHVPESVKRSAWGSRDNPAPWAKVFG